MNRWKITIEAWPHSTGNGQEADQKLAGNRSTDYVVRALDMADAMKFAEAIAMGVRANPMVWRAPIKAITEEREQFGSQITPDNPNVVKRWAVISLDDKGGGERQGYAYLYPKRPLDPKRVGGIGNTAAACIEISFASGQGLSASLAQDE